MAGMAAPPASPVRLTRRSFLAVSTAGLALAAAGCTSGDDDAGEPVTAAQVDALAAQVAAQDALVAAYAAAATADAALGREVAELAGQAGRQLDRLRAASPGSGASGSAGPATPPEVEPDVRGWLRRQVAAAADSHAAACAEQTGARAALLGSVAAGLRGHTARLA
jgi:hypothetical protein